MLAKDSEPYLNFIQNIKIQHKTFHDQRDPGNLAGNGVKVIQRIQSNRNQNDGLMSIKSNIIYGRRGNVKKNIGIDIQQIDDTVRGILSPEVSASKPEFRCKKRVNSIS